VTEQGTEEEDDVDEANMEANVDRRISILEDDAPLPSSAGNDKKPSVFPDTHEAFSFVVDILKSFQLHFVLDVAFDPLQIGIGYMFWKHRHLKEHLCKLFLVDRLCSPLLEHDLYNPNYHQQIMFVPLFLKTIKFGQTSWNTKRELIQSRTREPMDLTSFPSTVLLPT
jgi:hypothetical protein